MKPCYNCGHMKGMHMIRERIGKCSAVIGRVCGVDGLVYCYCPQFQEKRKGGRQTNSIK